MTFIYELDLDIMELYLYTKKEDHSSRHSKLIDYSLKLTLTFKFYLDLDPITFICKPYIDTLKIYMHTKYEVCSLKHSKVIG